MELPAQRISSVTVENVTVELLVTDKTSQVTDELNPLTTMTTHTHAYAELFTCIAGEITIHTEAGDLHLQTGDIAIIPAYLRHILKKVTNHSIYHATGIIFVQRRVQNCINLYRKLTEVCMRRQGLCLSNHPVLCDAVAALTDAPQKESYLPALRLTLLLAEIADEERYAHGSDTKKFPDCDLTRVSRLEQIINGYFMENLSSAYVAEKLFISQRQLSRIVKKRYGTTLHQAVTDKRLTVAAKMLSEETSSIAKIACNVGFGSVHGFYRAFRKKYAMSPLEYRNCSER